MRQACGRRSWRRGSASLPMATITRRQPNCCVRTAARSPSRSRRLPCSAKICAGFASSPSCRDRRAGHGDVGRWVAGKIKLIGLEEVKESLGTRWDAVAERAMASAEHVIRQRCGPRDICTRTADGGFLICFGDCSEDEAALRAAAIAREIRNKLIGDGDTPSAANVSSIAASIEVPDIPGQSTDALAAIIDERINTRLAQIEAKARETLKAAFLGRTFRSEQVRSRRTHDVVAEFVKLRTDHENHVFAAYSAWSVADRQNFDLDRMMLGHAADQTMTQLGSGGSRLILVNLDFDVFLDRRRIDRYLGACGALDPRLRERLVLVLHGMPRGFPMSRMLECVLRLRPYCHSVGFEADGLELPSVDFSLLSGAIVVLRGERLARPGAKDMQRLRQRWSTKSTCAPCACAGCVRCQRGAMSLDCPRLALI